MRQPRRTPGRPLTLVLCAVALAVGGPAAAEPASSLYVTANKAIIVDLDTAAATVSITSPRIADVHVLSPTRLVLSGKAAGTTSLVVIGHGTRQARHYDVVVQPPALVPGAAAPAREAHGVVVQRGSKVLKQQFVRDGGAQWVELGEADDKPDLPVPTK